ncbi:MAG: prepilin-type N-terminal cleavage/methylation domain-containing protein [Candidatus Omnitrophica bacterium]|nr:prepilin-type N-terminal cleavage/methylation domain-containing protein [Candidatus Omnitrophota bacterium]
MKNKGFTLIELIVVIAIIAVLAAVIAPNAFKAVEKAKISRAISDYGTYKTGTYTYYAETGSWPIVRSAGGSWVQITDNGFMSNMKSLNGWDGPYLEKAIPAHPWAGIYGMDCVNRGGAPECDIGLFFDDRCWQTGVDMACRVPYQSALKIDQTVDDGDPNTGNVRLIGSNNAEIYWIIAWDTDITPASIQ